MGDAVLAPALAVVGEIEQLYDLSIVLLRRGQKAERNQPQADSLWYICGAFSLNLARMRWNLTGNGGTAAKN